MRNIMKLSAILMATTALGFCGDQQLESKEGERIDSTHMRTAGVAGEVDFDFADVEPYFAEGARGDGHNQMTVAQGVVASQQTVEGVVVIPVSAVDDVVNVRMKDFFCGLVPAVEIMRGELEMLRLEVQRGRQTVDGFRVQQSETQDRLLAAVSEREVALATITQLNRELMRLQESSQQQEVERNRALEERNAAVRERDAAHVNIGALNDRILEIRQERDTARAAVEQGIGAIAQAHTAVGYLNDQLAALTAERNGRTAERDLALDERNAARLQVLGLAGELAVRINERDVARGQVVNLTGELDAIRDARDAARGQVVDLTAQLAAMKAERDDFQARLATITTERDAARKHVDDLQSKLSGITMDLTSKVDALIAAGTREKELASRIVERNRRIKIDAGKMAKVKAYLTGKECPGWTPTQNIAGALANL